ncbi:MAG: DUF45 domain-containing protein [Alphaproteobacteria bacterium]|nr:DUF45 domain-containing protein [Alphaproteobacteria bacterium]OJV11989.1 MAG: hypothetical protein BGO27_06455 [Alphaproteobacteria bacterium 33-17]
MPVLDYNNLQIPYNIRISSKAKRARITISSEKVEVVAPLKHNIKDLNKFIKSHKLWIFNKYQHMTKHSPISAINDNTEALKSGSQVLYLGQKLEVIIHKVSNNYCRSSKFW